MNNLERFAVLAPAVVMGAFTGDAVAAGFDFSNVDVTSVFSFDQEKIEPLSNLVLSVLGAAIYTVLTSGRRI